ncbi:hypothetical protein MRX96_022078 [Rhipicephalus microplus]
MDVGLAVIADGDKQNRHRWLHEIRSSRPDYNSRNCQGKSDDQVKNGFVRKQDQDDARKAQPTYGPADTVLLNVSDLHGVNGFSPAFL